METTTCRYAGCTIEAEHMIVIMDSDRFGYCDRHVAEATADLDDTPMTYEVVSL